VISARDCFFRFLSRCRLQRRGIVEIASLHSRWYRRGVAAHLSCNTIASSLHETLCPRRSVWRLLCFSCTPPLTVVHYIRQALCCVLDDSWGIRRVLPQHLQLSMPIAFQPGAFVKRINLITTKSLSTNPSRLLHPHSKTSTIKMNGHMKQIPPRRIIANNVYDGLADAIGNTPLIKLQRASRETGCNIYGKAEFMNPVCLENSPRSPPSLALTTVKQLY